MASRPPQSEPTFQDDGLWRKLLTRAQNGTTNHSFFVVDVVEGSMHTSMFCKLGLPSSFMAHHCKSLDEYIILEGPDGHQWPTMLGLQWDSQPCLMHGWKEFAADYNLEMKDQVVFLLFEDSHFLVQVYDVNNNVKRRVLASPEKVGRAEVTNVTRAGVQQRMPEDVVEKKNADTVQVQLQRRGSIKNPLLYFDTESMELGSDRPARKMDANPAVDLPSVHGYKTSSKENIIHILDSSEEEENKAHLKHRKRDASKTIKVEYNSSKMRLRSAMSNKKLETVDREDLSQAILQDVSTRIKSQTPGQPSGLIEKKQVNLIEEHVHPNDGTGRIMLGKHPSSGTSPDSAISAPSSPEHVMILKRSRRLQRNTGDYQGDHLGRSTSVVRSGKLYKLSQQTVKEVPVLREGVNYEPAKSKKDAFALKQVVGSEILTSCCSTEQSTMRQERLFRPLPKPLNLLYVSKRRPVTVQERQDTLKAAQAYAHKSTNRHFVLQLRTSQVYCGFHLGVRPEFVEAMQLPFTRLHVTLYDMTGKTWEVEWLGDHPKRPGFHSEGWTKFVLEHLIEEGDVCVFELPDAKVFNISVEIFPVVPLVETTEHGWRSHYIMPKVPHTVELPDQ